MGTFTSEAQRIDIKNAIQTELLKRGFHTPIVKIHEKENQPKTKNFIKFYTEPFQTTPVLFKEITIQEFASGFFEEKIRTAESTKTYYGLMIQVYVVYNHFDGGSNGCKLFDFRATLDENGIDIFNIRIS